MMYWRLPRRCAVPRLVTALILACIAAPVSAETIPAARQAHLMNLLVQDCGSCHGLTMKGGLGTPLLPENLDGKDVDVLTELILDGIPDTPMPPWRGQLSTAEAKWMVVQLKQGLQP